MKLITSHRLRNFSSLIMFILMATFLLVFGSNLIEMFKVSKTSVYITYTFLGALSIAVVVIVYTFVCELLKSETQLKDEKKKLLKNRIEFHNRNIDQLEKEIEKLN